MDIKDVILNVYLMYYMLVFLLLIELAVTEFLIKLSCFGIRNVMHMNMQKKKGT